MFLYRLKFFRKLRKGKFARVSGLLFVKSKWIRLPNEALEFDEYYPAKEEQNRCSLTGPHVH